MKETWNEKNISEVAQYHANCVLLNADKKLKRSIAEYMDDHPELKVPSASDISLMYFKFETILRSFQKEANVNPKYYRY